MSTGRLSYVLPACIGAFVCTSVARAALQKMPAMLKTMEDEYPPAPKLPLLPAQNSTVPTSSYSSPIGVGSTTAAISATAFLAAASSCTTYAPCNLFYQHVSVFYWPGLSQNTACLPQATMPPAGVPPDLPKNDTHSPSVYVFSPSVIASNGCSQIGNTYASMVTSFAPGQLSTLDSSDGPTSTRSFNFGDLPCGPANDEPNYAPLIAPPSFLYGLDPAFADCVPGRDQGVDPPTPLPTADQESGLGSPGEHPARI